MVVSVDHLTGTGSYLLSSSSSIVVSPPSSPSLILAGVFYCKFAYQAGENSYHPCRRHVVLILIMNPRGASILGIYMQEMYGYVNKQDLFSGNIALDIWSGQICLHVINCKLMECPHCVTLCTCFIYLDHL